MARRANNSRRRPPKNRGRRGCRSAGDSFWVSTATFLYRVQRVAPPVVTQGAQAPSFKRARIREMENCWEYTVRPIIRRTFDRRSIGCLNDRKECGGWPRASLRRWLWRRRCLWLSLEWRVPNPTNRPRPRLRSRLPPRRHLPTRQPAQQPLHPLPHRPTRPRARQPAVRHQRLPVRPRLRLPSRPPPRIPPPALPRMPRP
jgi:hypothetical protein